MMGWRWLGWGKQERRLHTAVAAQQGQGEGCRSSPARALSRIRDTRYTLGAGAVCSLLLADNCMRASCFAGRASCPAYSAQCPASATPPMDSFGSTTILAAPTVPRVPCSLTWSKSESLCGARTPIFCSYIRGTQQESVCIPSLYTVQQHAAS
jgi:hypothetical protein